MAASQVTKNSAMQAQERVQSPHFSGSSTVTSPTFEDWSLEYGLKKGPVLTNPEPNWTSKIENTQLETQLQHTLLEEDHIEQMIEELLDYGSIEITS